MAIQHQCSTYLRTSNSSYICANSNEIIGKRIKLSTPIRQDYLNRNVKLVLERDSIHPHVISGLIPIKNMHNHYFGDYHKSTIAVQVSETKDVLFVFLFKAHKPKRIITRHRHVRRFFLKEKPFINNKYIPSFRRNIGG